MPDLFLNLFVGAGKTIGTPPGEGLYCTGTRHHKAVHVPQNIGLERLD